METPACCVVGIASCGATYTHNERGLNYVSSSTGPGNSPLSTMRAFSLVALGAGTDESAADACCANVTTLASHHSSTAPLMSHAHIYLVGQQQQQQST